TAPRPAPECFQDVGQRVVQVARQQVEARDHQHPAETVGEREVQDAAYAGQDLLAVPAWTELDPAYAARDTEFLKARGHLRRDRGRTGVVEKIDGIKFEES